jgi:hypothetical protein
MAVEVTVQQWENAASNAEAVALEIVKGAAVMQPDRVDDYIVATAALLRCRAFLLGMVPLVRTQRRDIIGVLGRALFESWSTALLPCSLTPRTCNDLPPTLSVVGPACARGLASTHHGQPGPQAADGNSGSIGLLSCSPNATAG